jgi:predicted O-methyltransferase YrrM
VRVVIPSTMESKPMERLSLVREPEHRVDRGLLARSVFGLVGLRPPASEHTESEGVLLRKYSAERKVIVEIGVAEGASAWAMRQAMAADGSLYLIDPYHQSRLGPLGPTRLVAHRLIASVRRGNVTWIEDFSGNAASGWTTQIDFLFVDGDHSYAGVKADWDAWTSHLAPGGHVALHDASTNAAWTREDDGPVVLVRELRREFADWSVVEEVDSLVVFKRH